MKVFKHKNGRELVVLEAEGKAIAVSKETFDREYDPSFIDVKNVTVISETVSVEAQAFPPFEAETPARVKAAVGFEDRFLVTDKGDVLSKSNDKIMSTTPSHNGYNCFATYVGGREGTARLLRVHRLVADAFVPNYDDKPQVNHKDGIKTNNAASNLEWMTNQENQIHARDNGLIAYAVGVNGSAAKLDEQQVREIRQHISNGDFSNRELGRMYDISHTGIIDIKYNRTYASVI